MPRSISAPPPSAGLNALGTSPAFTASYFEEYWSLTNTARRMAPSPGTASRIAATFGWNGATYASISSRPDSFAASIIASTWWALVAIGFSTSTCLPARSRAIAWSAWAALGLPM